MGCGDSKEDRIECNDDIDHPERDQNDEESELGDATMPDDDAEDENEIKGDAPSRYKLDGPSRDGDVKEFWKGILFRVDGGEDGWFFYNDDSRYEVCVTFKTKSDLEAPEGGAEKTDAEGGYHQYKGIVYPGETKQWFIGQPNGWKYSLSAKALSEEYCKKLAAASAEKVQEEIAAVEKLLEEIRGGDAGTDSDKSSSDDEDEPTAKEQKRLLRKCIKTGTKYVDLTFKPNDDALSSAPNRGGLPAVAWKRPCDYLQGDLKGTEKLYGDGIEPNDVDQGRLGDCWFCCSMASLAESPAKVKDLFRHPTRKLANMKAEREVGAYRVTLNKHGWWHVLIMDDFMPCVGNTPTFAKNVQDPAEMWVALLEKAYARLHGSYKALAGGWALQALTDLTGYPSLSLNGWANAENNDDHWKRLKTYDEAGYMISVSTPGTDESAYMKDHGANNSEEMRAAYKRAGLGMGHAYSCITAKEFPKHNLRLMKIRNPWGSSTEWTGDWSDKSAKWDEFPDVKEVCEPNPEGDGTFWMTFEDVKKYFDGGGACFVKNNWYDYRVRGNFNGGIPDLVLEVTVKKDVEVMLILSQKDKRGLANDDPERAYAAMMLSVCSPAEGHEGKYSATVNTNADLDEPKSGYYFCRRRDQAMMTTLKARDEPYYIVPRSRKDVTRGFCLGLIADAPAGTDDLKVVFKKPKDDWAIFQNYTRFPALEGAEDVKLPFQFQPETGCPKDKKGSQFRGGKAKKSD